MAPHFVSSLRLLWAHVASLPQGCNPGRLYDFNRSLDVFKMDNILDHDPDGMDVCRPRVPKGAVAQWLGGREQQRVRPGVGIFDRYIQNGDVHSAHYLTRIPTVALP